MGYELWHRAQEVIAQGALTNSKHPDSHVFGVYPTHVVSARGNKVFDQTGSAFTDYICGLGTNLLGYGNVTIGKAVANHLFDGWSPSFPTRHEIEAAEKLLEVFPFCQKVKFLKTGTEACMAAVKMARNATGRLKVLSQAYHGWSDEFVSLTSPACGVPPSQHMHTLEDDFSNLDTETAAVIVEPVITDWSDGRREWLRALRKRCADMGAVLIFDEVITGFRFAQHSVSRSFNIHPDLVCVGKALANGLPLSAVLGSDAIMSDRSYFVSSTFAGEILSLVAAKAVIRELQTKHMIENLWERGKAYLERFNGFAPDLVRIEGYPTRGVFKGSDLAVALYFQEMAASGTLFCKSWFYNFLHPEDDDLTLGLSEMVLRRIHAGDVRLIGKMPQSPFAAKVRERSA